MCPAACRFDTAYPRGLAAIVIVILHCEFLVVGKHWLVTLSSSFESCLFHDDRGKCKEYAKRQHTLFLSSFQPNRRCNGAFSTSKFFGTKNKPMSHLGFKITDLVNRRLA